MIWLFLSKQRKMLGERKDESIYFLRLGIRAVKSDEEMSPWDPELAEDEQRDTVVVCLQRSCHLKLRCCAVADCHPPPWVYFEVNRLEVVQFPRHTSLDNVKEGKKGKKLACQL